ncbi:MAG: phosphate acetyltransferase, partial [Dysgonamonadaceae bacterium]|nr:phosphate acetyltransferase [Dysgonamonadaceae bacterium]
MDLMQTIITKAKANRRRIVLPEGDEERTIKAADRLLADGVADIILTGNPHVLKDLARQYGLNHIDKAKIVDPVNHEKKEEYANLLYDLRKSKGMTLEEAGKLVENPLYLGCLMIKNGDADGEIAGARNTTGDVLRPALQIIKTLPGISVVSGAFLMFVQDASYGEDGILVFADCAVMPNPTAKELAEIAVATAHTTRAIVGVEPRV